LCAIHAQNKKSFLDYWIKGSWFDQPNQDFGIAVMINVNGVKLVEGMMKNYIIENIAG